MGARRGEQGGAVAPPWKNKKKSLQKNVQTKFFNLQKENDDPMMIQHTSYVMRRNFLTNGPHVMR